MRHFVALILLSGCGDPGRAGPKDGTDTPSETDEPPTGETDTPTGICVDAPGEILCDGDTAVTCDDAGGVAATELCTEACIPDFGCVSGVEITVPGSDPASLETVGAVVEVALDDGRPFEQARLRMRRVEITNADEVPLTLSGSFALYDETGNVVADVLPAGGRTLYLAATHPGGGTLTAGAATLPLTGALFPGVSGRDLDDYPWFEFVEAFNDGDETSIALDPTRYVDRVGQAFDVYAVPHRDMATWAASPLLDDAVLTATGTINAGSIADNRFILGVLPAGPDPATSYDLVVDFDRDGEMGPGDLLDGGDAQGAVAALDLTATGPWTPMSFEYSTGVWTTMKVYTPDDPAAVGGLLPLIVISHGNGHLYTWYDYLGNFLASWGYVVIAHTNETGPGIDTASTTTIQNTEVFLRDLATLGGGILDGFVDDSTIAWIGHSRGGEGVVHAYNKLVQNLGAQPTTYDENDIVFLSSIAPTMFQGTTETNPHDRAYHLIAGSRDGDVTGGVSFGDVTQYYAIFQPGTGEHLVTYVRGADHNDFNCCGADDAAWTSGAGEIIGRDRAQDTAKSYYLALLNHYVRNDARLLDFFWRFPDRFSPIANTAALANQWRPAAGTAFVIDDFQTEPDTAVSSCGGAVSNSVADLVEDRLDDGDTVFTWLAADPMNGMTQGNDDPGAVAQRGIVFVSDIGGTLEWEIPAAEVDWSELKYLQFRATQTTRHPLAVAPTSFEVALGDANGVFASLDFGVYGEVNRAYDRTGDGNGSGWANEFSTVRIRLTDFETDGTGIDLANITSVRMTFGGPAQLAQRIGIDDLMVTP